MTKKTLYNDEVPFAISFCNCYCACFSEPPRDRRESRDKREARDKIPSVDPSDPTGLTADLPVAPVSRRRTGDIMRNPSPVLRNPSPGPDHSVIDLDIVKHEPTDKGYEVST